MALHPFYLEIYWKNIFLFCYYYFLSNSMPFTAKFDIKNTSNKGSSLIFHPTQHTVGSCQADIRHDYSLRHKSRPVVSLVANWLLVWITWASVVSVSLYIPICYVKCHEKLVTTSRLDSLDKKYDIHLTVPPTCLATPTHLLHIYRYIQTLTVFPLSQL